MTWAATEVTTRLFRDTSTRTLVSVAMRLYAALRVPLEPGRRELSQVLPALRQYEFTFQRVPIETELLISRKRKRTRHTSFFYFVARRGTPQDTPYPPRKTAARPYTGRRTRHGVSHDNREPFVILFGPNDRRMATFLNDSVSCRQNGKIHGPDK